MSTLRVTLMIAVCGLSGCATHMGCQEGSSDQACAPGAYPASTLEKAKKPVTAPQNYNPDLREMGLSGALSDENFEAARMWMEDAGANRQSLPAWQRLSVALASDDQAAIEAILQHEADALSVLDQVQALRRLGREKEALSLIKEAQAAGVSEQQLEALDAQRRDIGRASAQVADAKWSTRRLGGLKIQSEEAGFAAPLFDRSRITARFAHNDLRGHIEGSRLPGLGDEYDASTRFEAQFKQHALRVLAGVNVREDANLPYGNLHWDYQPARWLQTSAEIGVNELTDDTSALRTFGAKDRITAQVLFLPTSIVQARLRVGGHRFRTREDERLGEGYSVDGDIGLRVLSGEPSLQVRLQGGMQANSLTGTLPGSLYRWYEGVKIPSVDSLISRQFGQFGIGFRLGLKETSEEIGQLGGFVDGWMGGLWPAGSFAYHFRGGLGTSFFGVDRLSAEAFYANTQGGQATQGYEGVQVNYRVRF